MGSYRSEYIGPYMVAMNIKGLVEKTKVICNTRDCPKRNKEISSKFCPECGNVPETKHYEVDEIITAEKVLYEYDENFHAELYTVHAGGSDIHKDRQIIIPNGARAMPDYIGVDDDFCGDIELMDAADIMSKQLGWFNTQFKEILDYLRSRGMDVSVKWGIVVHYN